MTIGARIKETRASLSKSRSWLSKETGIPYQTLASLENGETRSTASVAIIAAVLGVDALWLSSGKGKQEVGNAAVLLPAEERLLLSLFRQLSGYDKQALLRIVRGLASCGEP